MFKVPIGVPVSWDPPLSRPRLDPRVLMAQAKLKSGRQTLPPPPELRAQKDDPDTWNVVLRAIQTPKMTDTPVEVANPWNKDPLYLDRDANRDKALHTMQERHRKESHSSSAGSMSSSGKHHRSGSQSRDETSSKRGQQTPMEDWNSPGPMAGIKKPSLNWSQDILEPRKQVWRPAAGDAPAMPQQTLKSVVKTLGKPAPVEPASCAKVKPWIKAARAELASCGKGRGQVIAEKLQAIAGMGPAAASRYSGMRNLGKRKRCLRSLPSQLKRKNRPIGSMRNVRTGS